MDDIVNSVNRSFDTNNISADANEDARPISNVDNAESDRRTPRWTPRTIKRCLWSISDSPVVPFFVLGMFMGIAMLISILVVYFSAAKPSGQTCAFKLKSLVQHSLSNDSHPHSVAVDDFNNDSWLDVAVANSGANNIGVFLGNDNGTFATQMMYSTGDGSMPYSVAAGDFNSDHRLDLVVANFGTNTIGIFLGKSNGTFTSQTTIYTGSSRPLCVSISDFNNDGRFDIATANYGTHSAGIFLSYGNGSFTAQTTFSTGYDSHPVSLVTGDFNHDSAVDIVLANYGTNNVGVLLGYGNGTFAIQVIFTTGPNSHPNSIAIADFNNDSKLDIVVANTGTGNVGVFLGYGNGAFAKQTTYHTGYGSSPLSVAVGHYNLDHCVDIIVANSGTFELGVFFGHGNGTFPDSTPFFTYYAFNPFSIVSADFNKDGISDAAVANYNTNDVDIVLGYGNAMFSDQTTYSTGGSPNTVGVAIGDFNNDGQQDMVVANSGTDTVGIFLGYDDGTFSSQTTYSTGSGSEPQGVAVGDINNDGRLDIVVANSGSNNVGVLLGHGDGTFSSQTTDSTGSGSASCSVTVGDFNNDGRLDIVVTNSGTNNVGVLLGYDNGTFSKQATYSICSGCGPVGIAFGDFNHDGQLDIVVANTGTNNVGVFLAYGDGTFSSQTIYSTGTDSLPQNVAVGDFNNDSRIDIVVGNSQTNNVGVFLGYGKGTFSSQTTYSTGISSWPIGVAIGDFNNDSRLDIVVANFGTDNVGVFLGYGDGTFSSQTTYSTGSGSEPHGVAIGDFNNDSRLDIVITNFGTGNVGVLLGYGDSTFSSQTTYSTGHVSWPYSLAVDDLNNDNQLDIVVANSGTNNVGVLLAYGDGTFSSQTIYSTGTDSLPQIIAIGDFNNDSRLDIVVANFGTGNVAVRLGYGNGTFSSQTTYSTGSGSRPYGVAIGDFNNDSRLDIVVANFGTDNVGVLVGYGNGTFSSQTTYTTGNGSGPVAVAVGDFNNDGRLDVTVINYYVSNVGVLLGYGDGTFSSQTTYSTGSGSGPWTVAVGDFNKDGRLDIVVAVVYYDHVAVRLGYGNGTFSSQTTYSTGSGSRPYGVTIGDFNNDGRLDIVVANYGTYNVGVLPGRGDGTFSSQTTYSTGSGSYPRSVAVGDFNNDDRLDITVTNNGANNVGVFLGFVKTNGVGEAMCLTGSASHPRSVAVGDFNNDTRLDVVVAYYGTDNLGVIFGDRGGTFSMELVFSTGASSSPTCVAVGDLNQDKRLDITFCNSGTEHVGILFGYGNGTFDSPAMFSTGIDSRPESMAIGDFNNDDKLDIVVSSYGTDNVGVFLKYDDGPFKRMISHSTGSDSNPVAVAVADFNNDSRWDIVVANRGSNNLGVLLGYGDGTFSTQTTYSTGSVSAPHGVAVGDFNNDSRLDIVVANYGIGNVGVLLGFGDGTFSNQTMYSTGRDSFPSTVAVGDFNNDGRLDIVVTNYWGGNIGVLLGYGNGTFASQTTYSTGIVSWSIGAVVGDFNNDSQLDIAVANYGIYNVGVFLGYGNGTFSTQTTYSTGSGSYPWAITIGDFNKDGRLDIAVTNSWIDNVGVLLGYGNGTFSSQRTYSTGSGSYPTSIAAGDFNNDSLLDLIVGNRGTNSIGILLGCSCGSFFSQLTYSTGDYSLPSSVAVGDFNNDSRLDIVAANSGISNVGVFLGYVSESFLSAPVYSTGLSSQPTCLAVGDFDNDGRLDVVVANNGTDNIIILFGSGYGTFSSQTIYSTGDGSYPCWVAVGDFDKDTHLDIVVANSGTDSVGVLFGYGNGTFSSQTTYFTGLGSHPYSVAVLDFDNDTRLDIAVVNHGSSSVGVLLGYGNGSFGNQLFFQTGFGSLPFAMTVGDVNNDDLSDIVVVNNGYGNIDIISKTC